MFPWTIGRAGLPLPIVVTTSKVGTVGTWLGLVWLGLAWHGPSWTAKPAPGQAWYSWSRLHVLTEPNVPAARAVGTVGIAKLVGTVGTVGIADRASRWHSRHGRINLYANYF